MKKSIITISFILLLIIVGQLITDRNTAIDNQKTLDAIIASDIDSNERLCLIDLHRRSAGILSSGYMYYNPQSKYFVPGVGMKYLDHWSEDGIVYMKTQTYSYFMIPVGEYTYECDEYNQSEG